MTPAPFATIDEAGIAALVHAFYRRVRADALLAPLFDAAIAEADWQRHLGVMVDFWSSVMLTTGRYKGTPMAKHMALPGLEGAHFERWLALWRETTDSVFAPEAAAAFQDRAARIARSLQYGLQYRPAA
ncbi:MAG TPA: group III truncated hemoglobin [Alphaproteobacteria bacterium]|nr:group III truncated hemoglobin [Alphaproteobacteria bacterium]